MAGIEESLMNFLRQYLPQSQPPTPQYDIPQGPSQWSMPSNTPRSERLKRAQGESALADLAKQREEYAIQQWLGRAQQGKHSVQSPVDPDLLGGDWQKQYDSYLFNYNTVITQINKLDDAYMHGKMSQADYDKANHALLPVERALDAKIKQLDQQRMLKAKQVLKGMHGDYRI